MFGLNLKNRLPSAYPGSAKTMRPVSGWPNRARSFFRRSWLLVLGAIGFGVARWAFCYFLPTQKVGEIASWKEDLKKTLLFKARNKLLKCKFI